MLGRLRLASVEAQKPAELSLEQRRRLALARALAVEPQVLLLDEPLANLDPTARKSLRLELTKLHRDLAVTTVHATRNAADALALSDRLAVIDGGRVLQVGDPAEVYHRPRSRAVAEALGPANFLPVRVIELRDLGVVVETERGDRVPVAGMGTHRLGDRRPPGTQTRNPVDDRGRDGARPEHSRADLAPGLRGLPSPVRNRDRRPAPVQVELPDAGETRIFRLGDQVRVEISTETVVLIPDLGPRIRS